MRRQGVLLIVVGAAAATLVPGASRAGDDKGAIDPDALAALDRMGAFLRSQVTMAVKGQTTMDEVLSSGQKVQHVGAVEVQVHRPDRMRADINTDRMKRQIFFDGKALTVFGPDVGYYASFPAPPTIREVLDLGESRYGIDFPLADLFTWGTEDRGAGSIRSATKLGQATVEGTPCDHYAFREGDVDWEVWIERGAHPLPRKLVITTSNAPSQPQYSVLLTWQLAPRIDDRVFTFSPPPNAKQIPFEVMKTKGGGQ
jgi:hypothetical protein